MDGYEVLALIRRGIQSARSERRMPVAVVLGAEARRAVRLVLPSYQTTNETVYGVPVLRDHERPWGIDVELDPLSPEWVRPAPATRSRRV